MKIAVIPARGGSKRIPGKNIRPFCGKPMISFPLRAAIASGCFDRVIVSTDSERIAETARAEGAEIPFTRPAPLADDHTPTAPVVQHAINWIESQGVTPRLVCCLYPTAPFVLASDLRLGLRALEDAGADFSIAVTRFNFPIQRALRLDVKGRLGMFDPTQYAVRSQDLEPAYHDAGQFYWGSTAAWKQARNPYAATTVPVIIPPWRVQDIDTPEDWIRAERLYEALPASERQP